MKRGVRLRSLFSASKRRVLSSLFTNLTAGWIGALIIVPNISDLSQIQDILVLILDVFAAIVSLSIAFWFEERSNK